MGVTNYLPTGMILQVPGFEDGLDRHEVPHVPLGKPMDSCLKKWGNEDPCLFGVWFVGWNPILCSNRKDSIVAPYVNPSGQISSRPHTTKKPPHGGLVRELFLFQGNRGWWNITIWLKLDSKSLRRPKWLDQPSRRYSNKTDARFLKKGRLVGPCRHAT